jgi:hypothetical protein
VLVGVAERGALARAEQVRGHLLGPADEPGDLLLAEAGLARIQLDKAPTEYQLAEIRTNANILSMTLGTIARRM